MVMAILQMRKGRMRKIKKPAQGPDEKVTSVNKSLLIERLLGARAILGFGDTVANETVSTRIFVEKGDMNKHLRFQSPLVPNGDRKK